MLNEFTNDLALLRGKVLECCAESLIGFNQKLIFENGKPVNPCG